MRPARSEKCACTERAVAHVMPATQNFPPGRSTRWHSANARALRGHRLRIRRREQRECETGVRGMVRVQARRVSA